MKKKGYDNLVDNILGFDTKASSEKEQKQEQQVEVMNEETLATKDEATEVKQIAKDIKEEHADIKIKTAKEASNTKQNSDASEEEKARRGRPKSIESSEIFTGRADSIKLAKMRAVAEKEDVPIKELYNLAFELLINAYEDKHGVIHIKSKQNKKDVSSLI